jgi:hypothetical protein
VADPRCLENLLRAKSPDKGPVVGITMDEYRASFNLERERTLRQLRKLKAEKKLGEPEIEYVVKMWPSVDMMRTDGWSDDEIESALERYYIGAQ